MKINMEKTTVGTFNFEFFRSISTMPTGGAELGEALKVISRIPNNDFNSWVTEWAKIADQVASEADTAIKNKQCATARAGFLRANNYYRTAVFFASSNDPRHKDLQIKGHECFLKYIQIAETAIEAIEIPYENTRLPGYFMKSGDGKRPTLIVLGGFDSTMEEMIHWVGFAAVERGWNCLVFEGPGQWYAVECNPQLYFRPDYEKPVSAVVDYVLSRSDVEADKLALIGYSFGGYLAPRAAAFEPRIKACIANSLLVNVGAAVSDGGGVPIADKYPGIVNLLFHSAAFFKPQVRWVLGHARWVMGIRKPSELPKILRQYTLYGLAGRIHCPLLCLYGKDEIRDYKASNILEALQFIKEIPGATTLYFFSDEEGAGGHCQVAGALRAQAVIFDWLERAVHGEVKGKDISLQFKKYSEQRYNDEKVRSILNELSLSPQ